MSIVTNSLAYVHADGEILFNDITISVPTGEKASLVGSNGAGKSTLLQIIAGNIRQTKGEVILPETPYLVPQDLGRFDNLSVMEVLRIDEKISALHAILKGDASEDNLEKLNDDWDIEERTEAALNHWQLGHLNLYAKMHSLSGGEKTKVFLAGISIHNPRVILLDEPTNHLDAAGKAILFDLIGKTKSTLLIVSHDRELLNLVEETIELSLDSVEVYGGNYDFYNQQKKLKTGALQSQLADKKKTLREVKQKSREITEQRRKQESRGKEQKKKAGLPRILLGSLQNTAERSTAKMNSQQSQKADDLLSQISSMKTRIEQELPLTVDIRASDLHHGKLLVDADKINLSYGKSCLWAEPLSFQIFSGDRILITGNNGAGKTSLIKAITKVMPVAEGRITIADLTYVYIDQEYSVIRNDLTVFEQARQFNNQGLEGHAIKMLLHHHQLPREYWDRPCGTLSGGEKVKLLLCCLKISNNAPDLLILDEPTNNLDVYSQDILTYAVKGFKGTILVISHDRYFINGIDINKTISL